MRGADGGRAEVLVVDDCRTVRERIREILEAEDCSVRTASDGAEGLQEARRGRPDIILVDFVMPGMNGYQFCQAVRRTEGLGDVPIVLVSLKADRIGEQFIRLGLANDVLSKPFQPAALKAVVGHLLERPGARAADAVEAVRESAPPPAAVATDPEEESRTRAARAAERAREILLEHLAPELEMTLGVGPGMLDALHAAIRRAMSDSALREMLPALADLDPHAGLPSFSGTLDAIQIGEVFQMISLQNLTGVMEVERPGFAARIFFSKGKIDLSRLDGEDQTYRLGRYLVRDDLVSSLEVERLAVAEDESGAPLGERLIRLGLISRDELNDALRRQAADIFYDVLRWTRGTFRFRPNVRADEAAQAALAIPVAGLLMEGYRRVDEWRLIEREIRDFGEVFDRPQAVVSDLETGAFSTDEKLILDHVDGIRSVSGIVAATGLGSFDVCRVLYRLLSMKLIHRARRRGDSA